MKLYSKNDNYTIYNGSMLDMLEVIDKNSIDAIVTDPPYELGFMGKSWDSTGIAFQKETWEKCFEVLKDGGYLLAFGGSRTFHRIAVAIEDAGFEIRDTIMYLYGTGFPKSMNVAKALETKEKLGKANTVAKRIIEQNSNGKEYKVKQTNNGAMGEAIETTRKEYEPSTPLSKQWQGWGTALKPAYEPVIVARKPFKGSLVENVMNNGAGGLNIDECRIGDEERTQFSGKATNGNVYFEYKQDNAHWETVKGRFPANVIHDGSEEVISGMPSNDKPNGNITKNYKMNNQVYGDYGYCNTFDAYDDSGSASRYFYSAKASKKDRDEGLDIVEPQKINDGKKKDIDNAFQRGTTLRKNIHPTVKPCELMQYLVRLVSPKGATILDCFMGSGSTGKAVMFENRERNANYKFIGIDLTEQYCEIANARIDYALNKYEYDFKQELEEAKANGQLNLFDLLGEQ